MATPADRSYAFQKRAFQEALKLSGVPICFNGVEKKCITGPIERKRHQDVVAMLGQAATTVDMLAEDFRALGPIVANSSVVEIDGTQFAVSSIQSDAADPCVRFTAIADH